MSQGIERFLDEEGKLKLWPSKQAPREEVFCYLAEKFELGRDYTEHEVNAILSSWHTFGDLFILRRGMIESEWLMLGGALRLVVSTWPDKVGAAWSLFEAAEQPIRVMGEALEFLGLPR